MSRNRPYQENREANLKIYSKDRSFTFSEEEDDSLIMSEEEISNVSFTQQNSSNSSNIDPDISSHIIQKVSQQSHIKCEVKYEKVPDSSKMKINHGILWGLIIGVLCILIAVNFNGAEHKFQSMKELNPFNDLKENFPSQSKHFWRSLEIVLDNALNKSISQPNIVLFISNGNVFPDDLFNGIVETTKFWLGNNVDPVELTKTDFTSEAIDEDYGAVLNIYKPKLTESRFMIVRDLNDIPANAAQAFHSFCDVYNPAVKRAVIFFTMKVNDFVAAENATKIAEKLLKNVWSVLKLNALQPLIGRVTDDVLVIK